MDHNLLIHYSMQLFAIENDWTSNITKVNLTNNYRSNRRKRSFIEKKTNHPLTPSSVISTHLTISNYKPYISFTSSENAPFISWKWNPLQWMKRSCHENCKHHGANIVERMSGRFWSKDERIVAWKEYKLTRIEKACHGAKIQRREKDFPPMHNKQNHVIMKIMA